MKVRRGYNLVPEAVVKLHQQVRDLPKVVVFLKSMEKNSKVTSLTYETGLAYFQSFLVREHGLTLETVLDSVLKGHVSVYTLLEQFVTFLTVTKSLSPNSVRQYLVGIRSYLAYYDIDIIPSKFKRKVKMPRRLLEEHEPLDVKDIRNILLNCSNRRLKIFILILASGGMRAGEALGIRTKDINFSNSPTKVHIRKEFSKTRVARDIYISDEATKYLKDWINWKYRVRKHIKKQEGVREDIKKQEDVREDIKKQEDVRGDDLIFQVQKIVTNMHSIYIKLVKEFEKVLSLSGLNQKKEGMQRRMISFHSFRRFVKTVISDQVNQDYSEWFLGHNKSPYYTKKEYEKSQVYLTKCMKYLTFLDYSTFEATGKNIEAKLEEKDKEIQILRERDQKRDMEITAMKEQLSEVFSIMKHNPKLTQVKPEILLKKVK